MATVVAHVGEPNGRRLPEVGQLDALHFLIAELLSQVLCHAVHGLQQERFQIRGFN